MPTFISIPNIIGNFYGGQPYNVDLQVNFDSPTILRVSVFNETGNYITPNPNYSTIHTIIIGNIRFVGYLVEFNSKEEASSRILELEYEDCSSVLDRIFIGLHKRHGLNPNVEAEGLNKEYFLDKNYSTNSHVVIVGREILKRIETDDIEYGGYSQSHTHDVGYHFTELLNRLGISGVSVPNINYVKDYSGNLREVLNSWCADYGLTYYWEFGASTLSGGLKFFDLKNVIRIPDGIINNCDITDKSIKVSARGTIAVGEVAYYDREGGPISYSTPPQLLTLRCLTIEDLFKDNPDSDLIRFVQLGIALSYYSQSLRDLLYWYNYRKIKTPEDLQSKENEELKEFSFSNLIDVYSSDINVSGFNTIKSFGADGDTIGDKAEKLKSIHGLDYYFFIIKYNQEENKARLEAESRIANEFLGKHWIRSYDVPGRKAKLSIKGPGIECEYIDSLASVPTLPFTNFGHEENTYVGNLVKQGRSDSFDLKRSIIYGQRGGMWYPNVRDVDSYKDMVDYYDAMAFKYVDSAYDNLFQELGLDTEIVNQANGYGIYIAFIREDTLPITYSPIDNFLDQNKMTPVLAGDSDNTVIGYYGLKSNSTYYVTFDGFQFMVPCGSLFDNQTPSRGGSYVVRVGETEDFEFITNKIQYTNVNIPQINGVAKVNINFDAISGDDISQIKPFTPAEDSEEEDDIRNGEVNTVKNYVKNVLNKTSFVQKENSRFIEFTIGGLPNQTVNIRNGLDSLSISVNENGVFTSYSYSDKLIKAQEATEIKRLRNILTNYNGLPKRYISLLEKNANQTNFIEQTPYS